MPCSLLFIKHVSCKYAIHKIAQSSNNFISDTKLKKYQREVFAICHLEKLV